MKYTLAVALIAFSSPALANEKLVNRARLTIMDVSHSFGRCEKLLADYHLAHQYDGDAKIRVIIQRMVDCEAKEPDVVQPSVTALRAQLKAAGKSEQPLKDFMMTYRKALTMLGPETSNFEATQIRKILTAKGEAIVAELQW